jgi:hypothetical protein
MKRFVISLLPLLIIAVFTACEQEPGLARNLGGVEVLAPDAGWSPYYPYETGKVWAYEFEYEHVTTVMEESDTAITEGERTVEVVRETVLTGENPLEVWEVSSTFWYLMIMEGDTFYMDTTVHTDYLRIEGDSVYAYEKLSDTEPMYSMPAEPKLGDEWEINIVDTLGDTTTHSYQVVADDAEANGYSNCLEIEYTPDPSITEDYDIWEFYYYLAWEVGQVFSTQYMLIDDADIVFTSEGEDRLVSVTGILE